jgi:hypothetical protein
VFSLPDADPPAVLVAIPDSAQATCADLDEDGGVGLSALTMQFTHPSTADLVPFDPGHGPATPSKASLVMLLLTRRQAGPLLLAGVALLVHGRTVRADHEYVAIVTNTQLDREGVSGMVGKRLVIQERPDSPRFLEGCRGVLMPAFHVQIQRDEGRHQHLLLGIDPTFHPDLPMPVPVQPGDRFVVRKSGSGDCGDGTSLLYLEPAPAS